MSITAVVTGSYSQDGSSVCPRHTLAVCSTATSSFPHQWQLPAHDPHNDTENY